MPHWSHENSFSPACTLWWFLRLNLCNSYYTDHMSRNGFTTMCLFKYFLCILLSVKVSSHWLHWNDFYCVWPCMAHMINVMPESFLIMAALIDSLQWPIIICIIRLFTEKPYHIGCIHIVHSPVHILICVFRSFASVAALSKTDIAFHQCVFSDISEILITVMPLIWAFPYVYIL